MDENIAGVIMALVLWILAALFTSLMVSFGLIKDPTQMFFSIVLFVMATAIFRTELVIR